MDFALGLRRKGARERAFSCLVWFVCWLCCFVADGTPELLRDLWWNFGHVVGCARVFCGLLQDVLLSLALRHKVAVHSHVSTADCFCHCDLLRRAMSCWTRLDRGILVCGTRPTQIGHGFCCLALGLFVRPWVVDFACHWTGKGSWEGGFCHESPDGVVVTMDGTDFLDARGDLMRPIVWLSMWAAGITREEQRESTGFPERRVVTMLDAVRVRADESYGGDRSDDQRGQKGSQEGQLGIQCPQLGFPRGKILSNTFMRTKCGLCAAGS